MKPEHMKLLRDKRWRMSGRNLASAKRRPDSFGRQASHGSMERSILVARLLRFLVMVVAI